MNPDPDNEVEALLTQPLSDECVWFIAELLRSLADEWENRHFVQMRRFFKEHRPPCKDPEHPWR